MTNLGAGFSLDTPETAGPTPPGSSGPPGERDRYVAVAPQLPSLASDKVKLPPPPRCLAVGS